MSMNLIIADTNQTYVERLTKFILSKYEDSYSIEVIDDKQKLKERVRKEKCEVLLLSPELYDPGMNLKNIKLPIILLDEEASLPYPDKFKRVINKYTRISSLLVYVNNEYEEMERNRPLVYGVYSPAGGVGKTTISLSTAMAYAKAGKKVLYFNLEDVDSTSMFFDKAKKPSMESLLNLSNDSYEQTLANLILQDESTGIFCFARDNKMLDPYSLSAEEVTHIVEALIESEMVNIVVIDLSTAVNALNRQVFDICDYLVMVADQNAQSAYKINSFMQQTELVHPIKEKLRLVLNQCKDLSNTEDIDVIGRIDKLYATNPLGLCEYIAQNHFLSLHGLAQ